MKMMLALIALATWVAASSTPIFAGTPPPGSPVRKAILDALRPAIEAKLGSNVELKIQTIAVDQNWAFVSALPQRRGGRAIDPRPYYRSLYQDDVGDLETTAVLQYRNKRWNLIEHAIGATDAWYCDMKVRVIVQQCGR